MEKAKPDHADNCSCHECKWWNHQTGREVEYDDEYEKARLRGKARFSVMMKIKGWDYNGKYYSNQKWIDQLLNK